ncbi:DUF6894 family protein [Sphingomonas aerophila]|jgi:hypothetical protein|uniref:DUF6894 domain-containing protein n=1 Tax=Sphingomonas aerophila TaxID=1344948 RepID=A0A7W9EV44_9SPHN|nr:hypothetical protein [Sphingomonas aerophila]MBB5714337.1 hypothetical protein [Sphingomonas aerophila]
MPRFYLHVFNDASVLDTEGSELPDLEAAARDAVQGIRELIAEEVVAGRPISRQHRIEIQDEDGAHLRTVFFGDVLRLRD